ncbi:hypothetical protein NUW58_g7272 [Xylaria curta]|uniref:Uncharacterized protein n=1 Tax=Xylaria curta TaxID=42375 RepID=A0ACC1NIR9_9PEZI|nr:hypothetical protein NUW58_g7272 [Xylaria curta]
MPSRVVNTNYGNLTQVIIYTQLALRGVLTLLNDNIGAAITLVWQCDKDLVPSQSYTHALPGLLKTPFRTLRFAKTHINTIRLVQKDDQGVGPWPTLRPRNLLLLPDGISTGTHVHGEEANSPLIICFHGSGETCSPGWDELARKLSSEAHCRVLLYDRGPGNSQPVDVARQMWDYVQGSGAPGTGDGNTHGESRRGERPELTGPYLLVAHSYGGAFARAFVQYELSGPKLKTRSAGQIMGLVLVETGQEGGLDPALDERQIRRTIMRSRPVCVIRGNSLIGKWKELEERERAGNVPDIEMGDAAARGQMLAAQRKLLLLADAEDERLKRRQLGLSKRSRFVHIPDCGHHVVRDRPDEVVSAVQWVLENAGGEGEQASLWQQILERRPSTAAHTAPAYLCSTTTTSRDFNADSHSASMTTLVQTRQPLQTLSMSNQPKRRRSERIASYDEQDGDFHFTRGPKRVKAAQPEPIPEDELASTPQPAPKPAPRRGRPPKKKVDREEPPKPVSKPAPKPAPTRTSRRRASQTPVPLPEAPAAPQRSTRHRTRSSIDLVDAVPTKATSSVPKSRQIEEAPAIEPISTPIDIDKVQRTEEISEAKKIALPFSDTPIINRNKEMRKKTGNRRSSVGMRGRRASSLIESGHSAIPHREVDASEFYKHIEDQGLTEPRRMKQLLIWCGERSLAEKPPLGSLNSNAVLGARAIQDQLLKDFSARSEFSDWFAREEVPEAPRPPAIVKPNPRNIEHDEHIVESRKEKWQSLKRQAHEMPPLFDSSGPDAGSSLPNPSFLEPEEARILASVMNPSVPMTKSSIPSVQSRLQGLQQSLEFKIDRLTDSVHKVEQRMETAGRQADRVLSLTAARLKEREEREKTRTGTKDMPIMEVLRGLSKILPDGGG